MNKNYCLALIDINMCFMATNLFKNDLNGIVYGGMIAIIIALIAILDKK